MTTNLPPNPYQEGTQKHRIYQRLSRYGRVKNIDILFGLGGPRIMNTTGRCSEVRAYLKNYCVNLECRPVNGSVFEYIIGGRS